MKVNELKIGDATLQLITSTDGSELTVRMLQDGDYIQATATRPQFAAFQQAVADIELVTKGKKSPRPKKSTVRM